MDCTSNNSWAPTDAAQLLVDLAPTPSLEQLLHKLVDHELARPAVAGAQVWLVSPGDRCAICPHVALCQERARCLHLAAGRGVPEAAQPTPRFHVPDTRLPLSVGFLGQTAATAQPAYLDDLEQRPQALPGLDWLAGQHLRGCGATPLTFQDEVLGVLASFTRQELPADSQPCPPSVAEHLGAALATARAFDYLQRRQAQLARHNACLQEEVVLAKALGEPVGESAALHHLLSQINLLAPTEAPVLILGETGTDKEWAARELHRRSPRKDGPFMRVNCAALPAERLASELFGHVPGAGPDASAERAGHFETAQGGTLFLEEIGAVPYELQSQLLRVLQDNCFERLGDARPRPAHVRLLAATSRDLKPAVAAGRFREDLYYRLHVFAIQVPPLRERKQDIPLLARHFAERSAQEWHCPRPRLTRSAVAKLQQYAWPGNVRELLDVVERAVLLARDGTLDFDLPASPAPLAVPPPAPWDAEGPEPEFLTEAELRQREHRNLLVVLGKTSWKIKGADGAAALLGLKPTTLLARLRKLGLQRPAREDPGRD